jgi:hypothetical protein
MGLFVRSYSPNIGAPVLECESAVRRDEQSAKDPLRRELESAIFALRNEYTEFLFRYKDDISKVL